jgi:GNAT superfamily N-acetyltransferase
VRLRRALPEDAAPLQRFPLGEADASWLYEVAEIVAGLPGWEGDPTARAQYREVIVLEDDDGELVGVAAHEATVDIDRRVHPIHRYLMVIAIRYDRQRSGLARLLVESVALDLQRRGVASLSWLVHPGNQRSLAFSRTVFPDADETYPADDQPYVAFRIWMADLPQ